jgi:putative molybdopterin biosynthesis protein
MEILSAKEIAEYLKINEKKIYQLVKDGEIPSTRIGGKIVFSREIIDRWIREKTEQDRNILVAGSDDPLLKRVIDIFNKTSPHVAFYAPIGSVTGLQLLKKGGASVCSVHILDVDGTHSLSYLDRYLNKQDFVVVRLFAREQGIYLPPGNPQGIKSFRDLFVKKLRFATRNPGSGTRLLIDFLMAREGLAPASIPLAAQEARSHLEAGIHVLSGQADAGFGIRYVSEMLKLSFIGLMHEPFDLVIPAHAWDSKAIETFLRCFDTSTLLPYMNDLKGYDVSAMGHIVWQPTTLSEG